MKKPYRKDLPGQTFGRLNVLGFSHQDTRRRSYWNCTCQCGVRKAIRGDHLSSGKVVSCGCFHDTKTITHGLARTPIYHVWNAMITRCSCPKIRGYQNYGGRGISVCERWKTFANFFADMGPLPGTGWSIDRIDNNGNYEPGNCRWATRKEQSRNKRTTVNVTIAGRTLCLADWADETGLKVWVVNSRYQAGDRGHDLIRPVNSPRAKH